MLPELQLRGGRATRPLLLVQQLLRLPLLLLPLLLPLMLQPLQWLLLPLNLLPLNLLLANALHWFTPSPLLRTRRGKLMSVLWSWRRSVRGRKRQRGWR